MFEVPSVARNYGIDNCTGFDAIIAREVGKRGLERIPVDEAQPDHTINQRATSTTNLVSVSEEEWQTAFSSARRAVTDNRLLATGRA
jgi:hypothetical protein